MKKVYKGSLPVLHHDLASAREGGHHGRRGSGEEQQLRHHRDDCNHNTDGLARRRQFTHTKTEHTDMIGDDGCTPTLHRHTHTHLKGSKGGRAVVCSVCKQALEGKQKNRECGGVLIVSHHGCRVCACLCVCI